MKRIVSFVVALIAVVICQAQLPRTSWPMVAGDPMHSSFSKINLTFPLQVSQMINSRHVMAHGVCLSEERIFIGDLANTNRLVVADLTTGDSLWSFALPGTVGGINFIPAVADGVVVVGGQQGKGLYAFNAANGDSLWLLPVGSLYSRHPVISDTLIYLPAGDSLVCINLHSGTVRWSFVHYIPQGSPVADGGHVYFSSGDAIHSVDKYTGVMYWMNDTVSAGSFASLALDSTILFVGYDTVVSALSNITGEVMWTMSLAQDEMLVDYPGAFAVTPNYLLIKYLKNGSDKNHYLVFDKATGQEINRYEGGDKLDDGPAIINSNVVEYNNGRLLFLDLLSGAQVYEMTQLPIAGYVAQVIGMADKVYLAGNGPNVIVLESKPSAVHDGASDQKISIYPNPAFEQMTVSFSVSHTTDINLRILTSTGSLADQRSLGYFIPGGYQSTISVDHLNRGLYYVEVQSGQGRTCQRIVIE